jgi:hypothetical protein
MNHLYKFVCETCLYGTRNRKDFNKHIITKKHLLLNSLNTTTKQNLHTDTTMEVYSCVCSKKYKHKSSLCAHIKKHQCKISSSSIETNKDYETQEKGNILTNESFQISNDQVKLFTSLVSELIKTNAEFQKNMLEMCKSNQVIHRCTNINNNTINNKFSLNIFLNETCKEALNISDFVNQLQITVNDLEETGYLGFAESISKMFIKGLKKLDICKRPVHCIDAKRETIYIKDKDKWEKEEQEKPVLKDAIKQIANKNVSQINEWTKQHPYYKDPYSKQNDKYINIINQSMSGTNAEECEKNYEKIMKNVVKQSVIQKNLLEKVL